MACVPAPVIPGVALPDGISLAPPDDPEFDFSSEWCCKQLPFQSPPLPPLFPPNTFNAGTAAALAAIMAGVQAYLDGKSYPCPRE